MLDRICPALIFLLGVTLPILVYSPLKAEPATVTDKPNFELRGHNLWGPGPGFDNSSIKTFREKTIDVDESGNFGPVLGVSVATTNATLEGSTQFICPDDAFLDLETGDCYRCPDGYVQNPALGANEDGVCARIGSLTTADREGAPEFLCPSGQFADLLPGSSSFGQCFSCPVGTVRDSLIPLQLPGACKTVDTADKEEDFVAFCGPGDFSGGVVDLDGCYDCPSGYKHNSAVPVNVKGVCWKDDGCGLRVFEVCIYRKYKNIKARFEYTLGCDSGEFSGGIIDPNRCYSCPSGLSHNGLLPVNVPGVCFANKTATQEDPVTLICNSDEFLDLDSGDCYSCPSGFEYNPAFSVNLPGVCFEYKTEVAEEAGDRGGICPAGQFLDIVTGSCYSCPDGYSWNPSVGVNQDGSCVDWSSLDLNPNNTDLQIGYSIDYDIKIVDGVEGGITVDPGSIDIDYEPTVQTIVTEKPTTDGLEYFEVQSNIINAKESDLDMKVRWPGINMYIDTFSERLYDVEGDFYYPEFDISNGLWSQAINSDITIFDFSTLGEQTLAEDPLLEFGLGVSGLDLKIAGFGFDDYDGGFDPPVELTNNFFTRGGSGPEFGVPVVELGVTAPKLNTPPQTSTDILDRELQFKADYSQDIVLGNNASIRQSIMASDRSGFRLGVLGGSAQETDVGRVDLDLDGITSVLASGGSVGTGFKFSVPTPIPLVDYFSLSASALDADVGMIFNFREDLEFRPNLRVIYRFSIPVLIQTGADSSFESRMEVAVPIGDTFEFIHPGGNLTITTRYSLADNEFDNDTDAILSFLSEMEILSIQAKVIGVPSSILPKATAVQLTSPTADIKLVDMNYYDEPLTFDQWEQSADIDLPSDYDLLEDAAKRALYELYRVELLNIATFPLEGFNTVQSEQSMTIFGVNGQPVARCKDVTIDLDAGGMASINVGDIDNGSTDFDGGPLANLLLDQTEFNCDSFGPNTVALTAIDEAGAQRQCTATVMVNDPIKPTATVPESIIVNEGDSYDFAEMTVNENCERLQIEWTLPRGFSSDLLKPKNRFCQVGNNELELDLTDQLGNQNNYTVDLRVNNRAPIAAAGSQITADEGIEVSLLGATLTDFGLFGHQAWVDWGDGAGFEMIPLTAPNSDDCGILLGLNATHTYADNGEYTVKVRVEDQFGARHEATTTALINNVAPIINNFEIQGVRTEFIGSPTGQFIYSGESIRFDLLFSDTGSIDMHKLKVEWQESDTSENELGSQAQSLGEATAERVLFKPGNYQIRVSIIDDDGGTAEKVVPLSVLPLTVRADFLPSDNENLINNPLPTPTNLILFSGQHELGEYNVENVFTNTIRLGRTQAKPIRRILDLILIDITGNVIAEYRDRNGDGMVDVMVGFRGDELAVTGDDRQITVTGQFNDGRYFIATDRLNVAAARAQYVKMMNAVLLLLLAE